MYKDYLKAISQYLLPKKGITALAGQLAAVRRPAIKNYLIDHFIDQYQVDMSEALIEDPHAYACFNDFFIRELKPGVRPLAVADIVSPADGVISETGTINESRIMQAKNRDYRLDELLGKNSTHVDEFRQGHFTTIYLSPKDYHRVHAPMDCRLLEMTYLPGQLFSVQPSTTRTIPRLFARNERLAMFFDTEIGRMAMVMVGATIVGSINTRWEGDLKRSRRSIHFDYRHLTNSPHQFKKGDEIGHFKLGSTVILLFSQPEKLQWQEGLAAEKSLQLGEALAEFK